MIQANLFIPKSSLHRKPITSQVNIEFEDMIYISQKYRSKTREYIWMLLPTDMQRS